MTVFVERLKELRKEKRMTQKDVATALRLPVTTYADYEQGTRLPPLGVFVLICDLFDVSADYLLGRVDGY